VFNDVYNNTNLAAGGADVNTQYLQHDRKPDRPTTLATDPQRAKTIRYEPQLPMANQ